MQAQDAACTSLPRPDSLVADSSVWAISPLAVVVRHVICGFCCFFFSSQFCCPLEIPNPPHRPACERVSYCVETSPSRLPPQDGSPSLNLLSLFFSFIFCPTAFQREWAAFMGAWCPLPAFTSCFVEVAQHSNDLFDDFVGEKVVSPSYSSATFKLTNFLKKKNSKK
ncbi:unnamed protein product [Rangifer tarandus platyrhynchus]|uniref:Uncharacterized protein n=2 Tax=Rangifer tarandus platyrhynchus TaxID=3082113 RepID=A0AC59YMA6_RANTA|nr:unnamed protein product [Rangifer tarandus platyrhynchus]